MKIAYVIIETARNENHEYIPCIVKEGGGRLLQNRLGMGYEKMGVPKWESELLKALSMFPGANKEKMTELFKKSL